MIGTVQGFIYLFISFFTSAFNICLLIRIFLPYFSSSRDGRFYQLMVGITEPVLGPIRRVIPPVMGLDFSPMVAMFLISMVGRVLTALVGQVL